MKSKALALVLILLSIFILSSTSVIAAPSKVTVIVRFKEKIDPKVIAQVNGQILKTYKSIPAVAAHVDTLAVETLRADPCVAYVEADKERRIQGQLDEVLAPPGTVQPPQILPWGVDRILSLIHI